MVNNITQIPIRYDRRTGIGKTLEHALCLSASDWRGLNRNQQQTAILEIWDTEETTTEKGAIPLTNTTAQPHAQPTQQTPFNYIELFSGIGGFRQALDPIGGNCVFASEIDRFATQSYKALYDGADEHLYGDITKVVETDVPDHDLLVAGIPCQAFSVAGNRRGFEDTRGTLFFDVARIAKEKQPKAVWIENVKGLVGHDGGRTLDIIVETLNAIGYHVDFTVMNSKYFGVPQNRERIFIVALRDDLAQSADWTIEGTNVVAKGKRRIAGYGVAKTFNFDWPAQESVSTRLRDVLEPSVDERYYLSEEKTAALITQLDEGLAIREATRKGYAIASEGDAVNFQFPDSKTRRGRVGKAIANTLEASGINQGVVEAQPMQFNNGESISYCLDASYSKGTAPGDVGKGRRTHVLEAGEAPRYRIRKLTPLECFRLQGFPDAAHQTLVDAGISDSQRYKQAGNAVTVNVISALASNLVPLIHNQPKVAAQ